MTIIKKDEMMEYQMESFTQEYKEILNKYSYFISQVESSPKLKSKFKKKIISSLFS